MKIRNVVDCYWITKMEDDGPVHALVVEKKWPPGLGKCVGEYEARLLLDEASFHKPDISRLSPHSLIAAQGIRLNTHLPYFF